MNTLQTEALTIKLRSTKKKRQVKRHKTRENRNVRRTVNMYELSESEGLSGIPRQDGRKEKANTPAKLLLSTAVFGILFSYLFTNQYLGVNLLLLVLLLYGFALLNRTQFMKKTFRQEKLITLFSLPVIFLAAYAFIGSTFLNYLSVPVILFVMFVQYIVLSDSAFSRWYEPLFLIDILFAGINRMLMGLGQFIAGSVNGIFKRQSEKKRGAIAGILIGTVLLILIIPLLLIADQQIAAYVSLLFAQINVGDMFLYIFMFLLAASAAAAPIATAGRTEYTGERKAWDFAGKRPVQSVTMLVALSMVSVVYILFAAVQFSYFFETSETMANQLGLTSSAYAVSGFGELLFVTCLNFLIIALALRFTKQKDGKTQRSLKVLYTILIAFNFVIMASSHMRLAYYEFSYGYTISRFVSHSFMLLLVMLNVIMLARIYVDSIKIIKCFAVAALLYFCALVAVNPELYVARSNIRRYESTGKIDAAYLFTLSGDAVSETCDFIKAHPEAYDAEAKKAMQEKYHEYAHAQSRDWQSINIADQRALYKLRNLS